MSVVLKHSFPGNPIHVGVGGKGAKDTCWTTGLTKVYLYYTVPTTYSTLSSIFSQYKRAVTRTKLHELNSKATVN